MLKHGSADGASRNIGDARRTRGLMCAHWRGCAAARGRAFWLPASHTCRTVGAAAAGPQARAHAAAPAGPVQECAPERACRRGASRFAVPRPPLYGARRRWRSPSSAEPCGLGLPVTIGWRGAGPAPGLSEAAAQPRFLVGLSRSSGLGRRSRLGPPRPAATPRFASGCFIALRPFGAAARCLGPLWSLGAAHPPLFRGSHVVFGQDWRRPDAQDPQAFRHPRRTPREPL